MEPMMTRKEAAEYLKVTVVTICRLNSTGALPYSRVARRIRISEKDIQNYLDSTRVTCNSAK